MKAIIQDGNKYVLRFDKDEEVIAGILEFAAEQQIAAAVFSGLGAASEAELAFFNPFTKIYRNKPFVEELEIVSFTGNISMLEGKPTAHAHGVFGRNDFSTFGGHVVKIKVSVTCEVFLEKLDGEMSREKNEDFNLNLLV